MHCTSSMFLWYMLRDKSCHADSCRFFFSSRRRHTSSDRDWSSDVCSSDLCGNKLVVSNAFIFLADFAQPLLGCDSDRKCTRLNSSHDQISYAVFCLKKKKKMSPSWWDGTKIKVVSRWSRAGCG